MKTIIAKGRDGFEGHTDIDLGQGRVLVLRTRRTPNGALASTAQVCKNVGGLLCFERDTDYSTTLIQTAKRCTERAVAIQHTLAEDRAAKLRGEITNFYSAQGITLN